MKITVKILQGVECCVEITEDNTTEDLKSAVERELNIPSDQQKLILKGKTLQNATVLKEYKIKEGDKVHLVVKAPIVGTDSPKSKLETELRKLLKEHFRSEDESSRIVSSFMKILERKLTNLSLDDIERICQGWSTERRLHF